MPLRENVSIQTPTGTLTGFLFVGQDGLPELEIQHEHASQVKEHAYYGPLRYRPSTFPAAWQLQQAEPDAGILFCAWRTIMEMQWEIAQAQREAEEQAREDVDAIQ